jgi:GNAT superfamily N-acetyltransferase
MRLVIHSGYLPGCIGRVTELHASYYSKLVGFGVTFEARVASELGKFCRRFNDKRDGLWLVTGQGGVMGSIAIDGSHAKDEGAHLRWFITAGDIQGSGTGRRLMETAMAFCSDRGYRRVTLWTFEGLDAARHLYQKFGFQLVHQQRGMQWGTEVNEQHFELRA